MQILRVAAVMAAMCAVCGVGAHAQSHLRGVASAAAKVTSGQPLTGGTQRPIIGILTLPFSDSHAPGATSYFPASYVKWLESGGARVVPIQYDMPHAEMATLAAQLNGVLFTGGGTAIVENGKLSTFGLAGKLLFDTVVNANMNGEHMPLWATCLGFEMLNTLASGDFNILSSGFDSENLTLPLDLTPAAAGTRMIGGAPANVQNILTTQDVTMNNHHSGVTPDNWNANTNLTNMFNMVSTNKDRQGREFVSTIEGKVLPLYSTQWHPEKVQFEWWSQEGINHSTDSVTANSYPARFFVAEARKNARHFTTVDAETAALIYNYEAVFTASWFSDFEQCYFFK